MKVSAKAHVLCILFAAMLTQAFADRIEISAWKMQDAASVTATGAQMSAAGFDASSWYDAVVPGTVLTTLVARGVYPDPYFGKNAYTIPDLASQKKTYWYTSSFQVPASFTGKTIWLCFDGINWIGDFYLNGKSIGTLKGAFKRAKINVTASATVGGTNYLAVHITGNATPGTYHDKTQGSCGQNGGPLGADNPTFHASVGWDWIPTIPDRDMGIWQEVYVKESGALAIRFPNMKTSLPLPSTSTADLTFQCQVLNASGATVSGVLKGIINPGNIAFSQNVTVNAAETTTVTLTPTTTPALHIANPNLWWPHGYGPANLYTCQLSVETPAGTVSDTTSFRFGVRTVARNDVGGNMLVYINGQKILCRGGSWGMDEAMKKFSTRRFKSQIRYHNIANLNIIRNWIGMTDDELFYDLCDENGIMIWDEFWLAHQADGPDPNDKPLWLDNAKDKILRYRSHPSVILWCCRNETAPPADLDNGLHTLVNTLDGTRLYLSTSGGGGVHSGGPWHLASIPNYYSGQVQGFHDELGMPSVPNIESIQQMMGTSDQWPINDIWGFHDWCGGASDPTYWMTEMGRYGSPTSLADFVEKSQFIDFDGHRALYEGAAVNFPNTVQGVILWMSNPCWPSLVWQLYDYYLDAHASLWGARCANEPQHIILDQSTKEVKIWNGTLTPLTNATVDVTLYDATAAQKWHNTVTITAANQAITPCFTINTTSVGDVYFAELLLKSADGTLLSRNFYWMTKTYPGSFTSVFSDLAQNKKQPVSATVTQTSDADSTRLEFSVKQNGSTAPALMIRVKVLGDKSGKRMLPFFASNNYFSLMPGQSEDVSIVLANADLNGENPKIALEGWNITPTVVNPTVSTLVPLPESPAGNNVKLQKGFLTFSNPSGLPYSVDIFDLSGKHVEALKGIGNGMAKVFIDRNRLGHKALIFTVRINGEIAAKFLDVDMRQQ